MHNHNRMIAVACAAVWIVAAGSAMAQQSVGHLEACTQKGWGFLDTLEFRFGTVNTCDRPVVNWFMSKGRSVLQGTVRPGGVFETEITSRSVIDRGWIFATCPVGYAPKPPVSEDNWDAIGKGNYSCVKE